MHCAVCLKSCANHILYIGIAWRPRRCRHDTEVADVGWTGVILAPGCSSCTMNFSRPGTIQRVLYMARCRRTGNQLSSCDFTASRWYRDRPRACCDAVFRLYRPFSSLISTNEFRSLPSSPCYALYFVLWPTRQLPPIPAEGLKGAVSC